MSSALALTYDPAGNVNGITPSTAGSTNYTNTYDHAGRLATQQASSTGTPTTHWAYDADGIPLAEYNSSGPVTLTLDDLTLTKASTGEVQAVRTFNHVGSPVASVTGVCCT